VEVDIAPKCSPASYDFHTDCGFSPFALLTSVQRCEKVFARKCVCFRSQLLAGSLPDFLASARLNSLKGPSYEAKTGTGGCGGGGADRPGGVWNAPAGNRPRQPGDVQHVLQ